VSDVNIYKFIKSARLKYYTNYQSITVKPALRYIKIHKEEIYTVSLLTMLQATLPRTNKAAALHHAERPTLSVYEKSTLKTKTSFFYKK